jgi:hypothetical protein
MRKGATRVETKVTKHYRNEPNFLKWFFGNLYTILREAQLGGRLLCKVGIHRWDCRTHIDKQDRMIYDYNRCVRTPFCQYAREQCVNKEPYRVP